MSYFLAIRTLVRKLYVKLNYSNVLVRVLVLVLVVLGLVLVLEIFFWSRSRSRSRSRHNLVSLTSLADTGIYDFLYILLMQYGTKEALFPSYAHLSHFLLQVYFLQDILNSFLNMLTTIDLLKFVYKLTNFVTNRLYLEVKMAFLCLSVGIRGR